MRQIFKHAKQDISAGVVVYLVALPLCLGLALSSGAPLSAGIISGVVAGLLVVFLSGSELSISGPAASLTLLVAAGIQSAGSYETFLAAVVIAGLIQLCLGAMRLGSLANLFPSAVINGMLAGVGLIIVLKQIPHGLGRDADYEGDLSFWQIGDQENTFSEIVRALMSYQPGIVAITALSMLTLWAWGRPLIANHKILGKIPAALIAVLAGVALNELFLLTAPGLSATAEHLVQLPLLNGDVPLSSVLRFPQFTSDQLWLLFSIALPIALVASTETLLCIEATDKLDPHRRLSDKNRELFAQGIGNIVCGLLGGLPMTSAIVRSSANIYYGAQTRLANVIHGSLLLVSALAIPHLLNKIPLSALAAVLIALGYKLARVSLFKKMWNSGVDQFVPFLATVTAIIFSDLLVGVLIGLAFSLVFVIATNFHSALTVVNEGPNYFFRFKKDVSFVHKSALKRQLAQIPENSSILIDGTSAVFIDKDIYDVIDDFRATANFKKINIELRNMESKQFTLLNAWEKKNHGIVSEASASK